MNDTLRTEADIAIIGAGVIGLAIAYELGRRGHRVLVIERDRPGGGATWASAGMLAPFSEAETEESDRIRFARDSKRRYPAFIGELEERSGIACDYRTEGTLWVAVNRDEEAVLRHLRETLRRKELAADWLEPGVLLREEPGLTSRVIGGLFVAEDEQLDPRALVRALVIALESLGGEVRCGMSVAEIGTTNGKVGVIRAAERDGRVHEIVAPVVVLAAGAWSTAMIRSPLDDLGVRPVKGQILHLRSGAWSFGARGDDTSAVVGATRLRHVIRTPEVYLVPRSDGTLLVGATVEDQGFFAPATAGAVFDLFRHAWLVYPALYEMALTEITTGFRPAVRDHAPVLGATEVEGLFVATGHFRGGVLLAPATAHYMADSILSGSTAPEIVPFSVDRLRARESAA